MPGFDAASHSTEEPHCERTAARNAKIGLILFAIYLILYAGFVLLNAFQPDIMDQRPIAGINLAVLSGFGLIVTAFVLALLYGWLCRNDLSDQLGDQTVPPTITETQQEDTP